MPEDLLPEYEAYGQEATSSTSTPQPQPTNVPVHPSTVETLRAAIAQDTEEALRRLEDQRREYQRREEEQSRAFQDTLKMFQRQSANEHGMTMATAAGWLQTLAEQTKGPMTEAISRVVSECEARHAYALQQVAFWKLRSHPDWAT